MLRAQQRELQDTAMVYNVTGLMAFLATTSTRKEAGSNNIIISSKMHLRGGEQVNVGQSQKFDVAPSKHWSTAHTSVFFTSFSFLSHSTLL